MSMTDVQIDTLDLTEYAGLALKPPDTGTTCPQCGTPSTPRGADMPPVPRRRDGRVKFNERQIQMMNLLLANGYAVREVAEALGASERHIRRLKKKYPHLV